ncbi:hypothetical protein F3Y22_tig00111372pilonHSYRG00115 [Hibiscus syriacus]|uniref:Reverse transcriptase zinc-binding domain-containing protein n=1 Tax=Hibiscus syriacus TaxID=106335 RepID=A0A6A2YMU7_HIBSY|nr:hypothetical protein F3Y22_tig00111372pilonHSYRG00115 [Hibiscus syriacus]
MGTISETGSRLTIHMETGKSSTALRFLANSSWINTFQNSHVTNLDRIGKRKRTIKARLKGIESALQQDQSKFLEDLESQLISVLEQEELLWRQKGCTQWALQGGRNTKFFHTSTMTRRRANTITSLKNSQGSWFTDQEKLAMLARDFYQTLFSSSKSNGSNYETRGKFNELSAMDRQDLNEPISNEEIRKAIFDMNVLGFKKLNTQNKEFITKLAFNIVAKNDALWVRFLRAKYKCHERVPRQLKNSNASRLWKAINLVWNDVKEGLIWNIGNGQDTDFWRNQWIDGIDPLISYVQPHNIVITANILMRVAAVKGRLASLAGDTTGWKGNKDTQFTIKSAYAIRCGHHVNNEEILWKSIHRFKGLQRIKIFIWLICKSKIMTNAERTMRHLTSNDRCPTCNKGPEDLNHLLRWCPQALSVWSSIIKPDKRHEFMSIDVRTWILSNLDSQNHMGALEEDRRKSAHWSKPPAGWVEANTDASCNPENGVAKCGGLIRDHTDVELDSTDAVQLLTKPKEGRGDPSVALHIREMLKDEWTVRLLHTRRENNQIADQLAKLATPMEIAVHCLDTPPAEIVRKRNN